MVAATGGTIRLRIRVALSVTGSGLLLLSSVLEWVHFDYFGTPVQANGLQVAAGFLITGDGAGLLRIDGPITVGLVMAAAGVIGVAVSLWAAARRLGVFCGLCGFLGASVFLFQVLRLPELGGGLAPISNLGPGLGVAAVGGALLVLGSGGARRRLPSAPAAASRQT